MTLRVNGVEQRLQAPDHELLVDSLRDRLGLTGVKQACSMGNCGTCTVRLDGDTVYSCLVLTAECDGREVVTVEGLSRGDELDPVQEAFVAADALQCGFCTPGQVMSVRALLDAVPCPSEAEIVHGLTGNLCRCGAYAHILQAAQAAAARAAGAEGRRS
jgi:aerobic-type carbon monoxide dehydrogenase small subunit (CoxS/CutS family)